MFPAHYYALMMCWWLGALCANAASPAVGRQFQRSAMDNSMSGTGDVSAGKPLACCLYASHAASEPMRFLLCILNACSAINIVVLRQRQCM